MPANVWTIIDWYNLQTSFILPLSAKYIGRDARTGGRISALL